MPDSAQVDSMKLVLSVPRGQLTGDSLAPQQLRAFQLSKSLPLDINNTFDPTGYYDRRILSAAVATLSPLSE